MVVVSLRVLALRPPLARLTAFSRWLPRNKHVRLLDGIPILQFVRRLLRLRVVEIQEAALPPRSGLEQHPIPALVDLKIDFWADDAADEYLTVVLLVLRQQRSVVRLPSRNFGRLLFD